MSNVQANYEFVVEPEETATSAPATTAAPISWETFQGAQYYRISQAGLTWQQARLKCQVNFSELFRDEWRVCLIISCAGA